MFQSLQWVLDKQDLMKERQKDLKFLTEEEYWKLQIFFANGINYIYTVYVAQYFMPRHLVKYMLTLYVLIQDCYYCIYKIDHDMLHLLLFCIIQQEQNSNLFLHLSQ